MSELNVKPILRQFLLSITGNDIMQTNNDNYDCIDRFIESDRFQVALKQANVVATGGGQLTMEKTEMIVKLILAKLEITKMKADGYNWGFVAEQDKNELEKALIEIDKLLEELRA